VHSVLVDNFRGGFAATEYLIRSGHRRIAFLGGPKGLMTVMERHRGYQEALTAARMPRADEQLVRFGAYTEDFGRVAFPALWSLPVRPTAVVAANDLIALGAIQAASQVGVSVPRDLSVVGFDDIPLAGLLGLTTVRQPVALLGEKAILLLLEIIRSKHSLAPHTTTLDTELVIRGTTAPPGVSGDVVGSVTRMRPERARAGGPPELR